MCGRFTQFYTWRELVALYRLTLDQPARNIEPRYNIAPTTTIDTVVQREGVRELVSMRWGLCPSWWKKALKDLPATFNARAEAVVKKPMFRAAFKTRRCIIPASGYYEWKATAEGKQPHFVSAADGRPLSIAGLWEEWRDPQSKEPLKSCTIIVCAANEFTRAIHDRMPVLLAEKDFEPWLSGAAGVELCGPAPDDVLRMWPVSKRVNKAGSGDDPSLIEAIVA